MNALPKVVFSRTLPEASWQNTELVTGDIEAAVLRMKQEPGPDMVIMGSGTIVAQLTEARLIDGYQIVVTPIVLGSGRTMFDGVPEKMDLRLTSRGSSTTATSCCGTNPRADGTRASDARLRLAVAEGFEPSRELPPYTLSRRVPSAARAGHRRRV